MTLCALFEDSSGAEFQRAFKFFGVLWSGSERFGTSLTACMGVRSGGTGGAPTKRKQARLRRAKPLFAFSCKILFLATGVFPQKNTIMRDTLLLLLQEMQKVIRRARHPPSVSQTGTITFELTS